MNRLTISILVASASLLIFPTTVAEPVANAPDSADLDGPALFERMKSLVGTWRGKWNPDDIETTVTYSLTGNGSVLVEDYQVGETTMSTLYHLDGETLMLTHYCSMGNQPRMKATSLSADGRELVFDQFDVTNLTEGRGYSERLAVTFLDDDHLSLVFRGSRTGRNSGVELERVREASKTARIDTEAAFERLKATLVGEWQGRLIEIDSPVEATFYLTGNGSALVEDIRRPTKPGSRMHSVYHLADAELRLTHYCSFRNQPRLVATAVRDSGGTIEFELLDVTNLSRSGDRYTHRLVVSLSDQDRVSITFVGLDQGQEGTLTAELTRVG